VSKLDLFLVDRGLRIQMIRAAQAIPLISRESFFALCSIRGAEIMAELP
jgi:hypothetical protein